jgi:hypothetical protein
MIRNLKINVAYDNILVYDENGKPLYGTSNVAHYDIHPWHTITHKPLSVVEEELGIKFPYFLKNNDDVQLKHELFQFASQNLENILDNTYENMVKNTVKHFYDNNQKFIYPVVLYNNDLFIRYETMNLNDMVIESIKNKMAKLVFIQPTEGFFGMNDNEFIWLNKLSKKYSLNSDDVIMITANMQAKDRQYELISRGIIEDNFTVYPYSYFEHNIWFHYGKKLNIFTKNSLSNIFYNMLQNNKTIKKNIHFLNFNRVPKLHRLLLFAELNLNENLKGKSITTLGGTPEMDSDEYSKIISVNIPNEYKHSKEKLFEFYKTYDSKKHSTYDVEDLENNKAGIFNKEAHGRSFLNIISESMVDNTTIFFSEKTFKPILACQPFIMCGNPHSLKKLKELGYMTFDRWWDESYDDEINFIKRMEKIIDVLEEISKWDMDKCFRVTQEMEEVLTNNFFKFISDKDIDDVLYFLSFKDENINNNKNKKLI